MKKELEDIICAAAPTVMRDMRGDMTKTCLAFGFECGDGWFNLIYEAAVALEALDMDIHAAQVKEKFGGLRFYLKQQPKEADAIIRRAEERSYLECDQCGAAGKRGNGEHSYIRVMCDKHAAELDQD